MVPIPDTKRRKYLEENAAAIRLSTAEVDEIEAAVPKSEVVGGALSGSVHEVGRQVRTCSG